MPGHQDSMSAFRDLIVWQRAMETVEGAYEVARQLPQEERFGLISQIQRSAISIPSNIAEGAKRNSKKEFKQFLHIAAGSAAELETQLLLVVRLHTISVSQDIFSKLNEVQRMLQSLILRF